MEKEEVVKHWLDSADQNAKLAKDLFSLKHYSWCLFMWSLAIEKTLKAKITSLGKEILYIHDLVKLANLAELSINSDMENELDEITTYNVKARYEDYKKELYNKATKEYTKTWNNTCEKIYKWIKTTI